MNTNTIKDYKNGKSISAIAKEENISNRKVKHFLLENGCQLRTRSQQNILSNQARAKSVNDSYFSVIDSPEKAWLLGFLAADGSVDRKRNRIKIGLSSIDEEILIKIKKELEIEKDIYSTITSKGFSVSELTWSSFQMKKDLAKFGIIPNKTYLNSLSMKSIPEELKPSYILGYYDGDGSLRKDGRLEICSYTNSLLLEIASYLNNRFGQKVKVYKDRSRENYYTITYSYKPAKEILSFLYGQNPNLFLKRKKLLFQNIIEPRDYDNH